MAMACCCVKGFLISEIRITIPRNLMHYLQVVYHISHFSTIEEGFLLEALSSLMEKKKSATIGQL